MAQPDVNMNDNPTTSSEAYSRTSTNGSLDGIGLRDSSTVQAKDDIEGIAVPKDQNYDVATVMRYKAGEHMSAQVALRAQAHDNKEVVLWALMDTGSCANIINRTTVERLLGADAAVHMKPLIPSIEEPADFVEAGGNHFIATHTVNLDFTCGKHSTRLEKLHFVVWESPSGTDSDTDGFPDVILGLDTLLAHSMMLVNWDFLQEPAIDLPVIAQKAEVESPAAHAVAMNFRMGRDIPQFAKSSKFTPPVIPSTAVRRPAGLLMTRVTPVRAARQQGIHPPGPAGKLP